MTDVIRKSVFIAAMAIGAALVVAAHTSLAHSPLVKPSTSAIPKDLSRA